MTLTFLESRAFTARWLELADDETLRALQNELLRQPDKGDVLQGTGGFRKLRVKLPGRGKSAGARAIYLHVPEAHAVVLVALYTKAEKTDLYPDEKKTLRQIAAILKRELV